MTIADLSQVWVASEVPESRIRHIRVGDPVVITLVAYPEETFAGRVARIADVLDPETRTLKVHVELPNPGGRLRPDMFATVRHSGQIRLCRWCRPRPWCSTTGRASCSGSARPGPVRAPAR